MNTIRWIILAVLLAIGVAYAGSYLVVLSQNPASHVNGPTTLYGSVSP